MGNELQNCSESFNHQSSSFRQADIPFPWLHLTVQKAQRELPPVIFCSKSAAEFAPAFQEVLCQAASVSSSEPSPSSLEVPERSV